jgi:hypothetical protein
LVQSVGQTEGQLLELNYPIHRSTREANPTIQVRYKDHLGAVAHLVMTIMAHNSTVVERICQRYLSKRAEKSRQLLGLRHGMINEINNPKNQWLLHIKLILGLYLTAIWDMFHDLTYFL